ncbi:hypothetical protein ABG79_01061 [Caloramator mitchellensis]|uniref:Uncharacterized protein n=1 Tax=Caloramator mitchellensis TaxID=908809 RepID=A0A0R3JW18_CALMK|nr:ABC transporter permease [Caloramator mitchellensis]KRQ87258.1 hypothetical protein ABG79_01061 [Caloramator mitchellensis]
MNKAISLIKLYVNSVFGLNALVRDIKYNKKNAFKALGLILLIMFSFSGIVTMFAAFNIKMFDLLKQINQQGLIVLNTVVIATYFTFFIGIITVIGTYYLNQEGDIILSLPLKPWNLFLAKFTISYISEAILSTVIMATGIIVYGIKNNEGALFYLFSIVVTLLIPIIPLVIGYFLISPIMKFGKLLKKKDLMMYLSGFFAISISFVFQYFSNSLVRADKNPELVMQKLTEQNGYLDLASQYYYPAVVATKSIVDSNILNKLGHLILFIAIVCGALFLLIITLSDLYYDTLIGSTELKKNTKKITQVEFKKSIKRRNIIISLLDRELKLMNREPIYFINGPMVIILLPLIFGASFYFQKDSIIVEIKKWMVNPNFDFYTTILSIGAIIFLGASTSITATCISREGRAFELIKSLPINPKYYIQAKLLHGSIFGLLASVFIILVNYIIFKLSIFNIFLIVMISNLILIVIYILEILAELRWPKLNWDNPQKAIKQNINGIVGMLGTMGLVAFLGFVIIFFKIKSITVYTLLTIIPLIAVIFLYKFLIYYVDKKFYEIEI